MTPGPRSTRARRAWRPALLAVLPVVLAAPHARRLLASATGGTAPCIRFPLASCPPFRDNYGEPRGRSRRHEGIDILAPRMTPVLAATDGTVTWMRDERGGRCCDLEVRDEDGWRTRYIHLNNDTPGTDDGKGWGFAPGIAFGARVRAGDVIGYVGDSGNAETTSPHLHFELRRPDGSAIDPNDALLAALAARTALEAPRQEALRPPDTSLALAAAPAPEAHREEAPLDTVAADRRHEQREAAGVRVEEPASPPAPPLTPAAIAAR